MHNVLVMPGATACRQETILFDAYLLALSHDLALTISSAGGQLTTREATAVHSQLINAKDRYLAHVQRHGCGSSR